MGMKAWLSGPRRSPWQALLAQSPSEGWPRRSGPAKPQAFPPRRPDSCLAFCGCRLQGQSPINSTRTRLASEPASRRAQVGTRAVITATTAPRLTTEETEVQEDPITYPEYTSTEGSKSRKPVSRAWRLDHTSKLVSSYGTQDSDSGLQS